MNTNNDVKWRRFIVPKKVEQINDHLFKLSFRIKLTLPIVRILLIVLDFIASLLVLLRYQSSSVAGKAEMNALRCCH